MDSSAPAVAAPPLWRVLLSARMAIAFAMGFSCGLPLLLTGSVLQAWMTDQGMDLSTIGVFALVGLPYTLKFLWAPLFDRYASPWLGRRRGALLLMQLALIAALVALAWVPVSPWPLALAALAVTVFSASQDIIVDAYRREALIDAELGLGASMYVNGYRVGMLLASGGGLILADFWGFQATYLLMAAVMGVGVITTLLAPEPERVHGQPRTLMQAVVGPLREFFSRPGVWWILGFILLYKVGDTLASQMTTPFYLAVGFTKTEIGAVVKLFGFWATLAGGLIGGLWLVRIGIARGLWIFGVAQGVSTAGFAALVFTGPSNAALAAVVAFENFTGGLGTAAYVAYMGSLTDRRFTAAQYALLSSLMGVPRVILAAPSGWAVEQIGWVPYFLGCAALALPGLMVLWALRRRAWV